MLSSTVEGTPIGLPPLRIKLSLLRRKRKRRRKRSPFLSTVHFTTSLQKSEEKEKLKDSPDAEATKTIEDEIANGSLVLSDETGADQLVEMDSSETHPTEDAKEEVQA